MNRYAVIVAAGTGSRMNAGLPKQFMLLKGRPVLFYSLLAFHRNSPETKIIVVLAGEEKKRWEELCALHQIRIPHLVTEGGKTRTESVRNGLKLAEDGLVAIHDGARPMVQPEMIEACYFSAESNGSGVPAIPVKDSIRIVENNTNYAVNREDFRLMQTPQTFRTDRLKKAYDLWGSEASTDDATIYEKAGYEVNLVIGDYSNIKITTPEDLYLAEILLKDI